MIVSSILFRCHSNYHLRCRFIVTTLIIDKHFQFLDLNTILSINNNNFSYYYPCLYRINLFSISDNAINKGIRVKSFTVPQSSMLLRSHNLTKNKLILGLPSLNCKVFSETAKDTSMPSFFLTDRQTNQLLQRRLAELVKEITKLYICDSKMTLRLSTILLLSGWIKFWMDMV